MGAHKGQKPKADFTSEEIKFIVENAPTMFYAEIGTILGRTKSSIKNVARRLKLSTPSIKKRLRGHSDKRRKDLTGQRFHKLLAQKYIRTFKKRAVWLCLCDCGKTKEVAGYQLRTGHVKSCGCIKSDRQYESIINSAYRGHTNNAKVRGIENFLSKEEYVRIAKNACVYCDQISIRTNEYTGATMELNSVDRIDNDKFYTLETVQAVCFICQNMKGVSTHKDFLKHVCKMKEKIFGK